MLQGPKTKITPNRQAKTLRLVADLKDARAHQKYTKATAIRITGANSKVANMGFICSRCLTTRSRRGAYASS